MRKLIVAGLLILIATLCSSISVVFKKQNIGDVQIYYDGKVFHCDKIICPESAVLCIVKKNTLKTDNTKLERWARCIDRNNSVVLEDKREEPNPSGANIDLHMEDGKFFRYSSSYGNEQAQEVIEKTFQKVEKDLEKVQKDLQKQLGDLERMFS